MPKRIYRILIGIALSAVFAINIYLDGPTLATLLSLLVILLATAITVVEFKKYGENDVQQNSQQYGGIVIFCIAAFGLFSIIKLFL